MDKDFFTLNFNKSEAIIATAIHDGDFLSHELLKLSSLSACERRREEDPFTGELAELAPSSLICHKSRFECDLNRPREKAVYKNPEDAWGLNLWKGELSEKSVDKSLEYYDQFYKQLHTIYSELIAEHRHIVVLDFHSYNYRRKGVEDPGSPESTHPSINIGTGTMRNPWWRPLIENFINDLRNYSFFGKSINVQENLIFKGGQHALWAHQTFPHNICVLSIEVKKFFMDEWSGELYSKTFDELKAMFSSSLSGLSEQLQMIR